MHTPQVKSGWCTGSRTSRVQLPAKPHPPYCSHASVHTHTHTQTHTQIQRQMDSDTQRYTINTQGHTHRHSHILTCKDRHTQAETHTALPKPRRWGQPDRRILTPQKSGAYLESCCHEESERARGSGRQLPSPLILLRSLRVYSLQIWRKINNL